MILTERAANVLQTILSNRIITIDQLSSKLGYTKRQISYDLQKINDWLESNRIPPIQNRKELGLTVPEGVRNQVFNIVSKIDLYHYIASPSDRQKIMYLQLFMKRGYLSVNHLTDQINMSRNTVLSYIQLLKEELENRGISLVYNRQDGYGLIGEEFTIRSLAFEYLSYVLKLPNGWQLLENIYRNQEGKDQFLTAYQLLFHKMTEMEQQLHISFVEEQLKELTIFFLFLKLRILAGFQCPPIKQEMKSIIQASNILNFSKEMLETLAIGDHPDEAAYITMHLLGLNTIYETELFQRKETDELLNVVDQILTEFEKNACILFNNRENILNSLYLHIRPVYYRSLFQISVSNPYVEDIKREYYDLFILVKKSIKPLELYLNKRMADEEVGYITLHFGGYVKREELTYRRKRCFIICPNGIATSNMLKNQLEQLIPEVEVVKVMSPRQFHGDKHGDVDFIIATIPIQTMLPVIIVSPILTSIDKAKILMEVNFLLYNQNTGLPKINEMMHIIKEYATIHDEPTLIKALTNLLTVSSVKELGRVKPVLNQLLTKEMITITDNVSDWKAAIRIAAAPLLEQKKIEATYIEAMIANVEKIGPYIVLTPKVAIPHARPEDGVKELSMSLLKIDHPVSFAADDPEKDVQLIFIIAAIDNDLHLKALSQLSNMLEEDMTVDQLIQAKTVEEIQQFVNHYSKK
ncbi:BglG family transcription antiterminator [Caldibacillus lycopersici]|uniref:BglG family transcription antiterminator n=1 Tax=Perspicuibacillus lycopersici TaxID=1325689 RepID=A0AAE3ITE8_9BACI|nr:BglG family transcription antiterminator [Perspicuibacillus lycopersici]MCU9613131.1 BglG family transcription antiterminator [Perspicuibacillus lycopersici]